MEDQRRRSLEALERRFSQAKSEVQSQQQMSKKRPAEDKKTFFVDSPLNKPLSISSSKKGNFSFPDRTSKEGLPQAMLIYFFDIFKAMHEKWKSYIQKLLKLLGENSWLSASLMSTYTCKTAAYVGLHGIMVRETKETFGIVTQDSKFEVVPKKLSVFMLEANHWKITLNGDKLVSRNLDTTCLIILEIFGENFLYLLVLEAFELDAIELTLRFVEYVEDNLSSFEVSGLSAAPAKFS
ncbi:hypothetical protein SASPL_155907 [Salvia splendens]|uniref:Uncharacterized protein n=1 Tax=Salvia splendens TaxID=180675 RepID=A0A8X8VXK2_SALSN|nr:hypothetical protein SASPL_155907 [Salvia splendens]